MNPVAACPHGAPFSPLCPSEAIEMTGVESEDAMISKAEARELIDDLFEEEALVIGGIVAVHDIDDDLVWRLVRNLDVIRGKALRRLGDKNGGAAAGEALRRPNLKPHPAIEDFLLKIRRT